MDQSRPEPCIGLFVPVAVRPITYYLLAPVSSFTDSSFLSNSSSSHVTKQERRAKLQKFLLKRKQRDYSKKIRYHCRKSIAEQRKRQNGRFSKLDDEVCSSRKTTADEDIMASMDIGLDITIDSL